MGARSLQIRNGGHQVIDDYVLKDDQYVWRANENEDEICIVVVVVEVVVLVRFLLSLLRANEESVVERFLRRVHEILRRATDRKRAEMEKDDKRARGLQSVPRKEMGSFI
jgi:hypothetical protein